MSSCYFANTFQRSDFFQYLWAVLHPLIAPHTTLHNNESNMNAHTLVYDRIWPLKGLLPIRHEFLWADLTDHILSLNALHLISRSMLWIDSSLARVEYHVSDPYRRLESMFPSWLTDWCAVPSCVTTPHSCRLKTISWRKMKIMSGVFTSTEASPPLSWAWLCVVGSLHDCNNIWSQHVVLHISSTYVTYRTHICTHMRFDKIRTEAEERARAFSLQKHLSKEKNKGERKEKKRKMEKNIEKLENVSKKSLSSKFQSFKVSNITFWTYLLRWLRFLVLDTWWPSAWFKPDISRTVPWRRLHVCILNLWRLKEWIHFAWQSEFFTVFGSWQSCFRDRTFLQQQGPWRCTMLHDVFPVAVSMVSREPPSALSSSGTHRANDCRWSASICNFALMFSPCTGESYKENRGFNGNK